MLSNLIEIPRKLRDSMQTMTTFSSETFINVYEITLHHIPEEIFHSLRRENLKP